MGTSTQEKCLLKLVHPGRHIEYHKRPVTAAEIMRKNPRHSITRPDFFSNPVIVVRPESIMVPGQVFYIVPNTTVHKLFKNRSTQLSNLQQITESPKTASKQTNTCTLWAGTTPMQHFHQEQEGSSSSCDNSLLTQSEEALDDNSTLRFQAKDFYLNRNGSAWSMPLNRDEQQRSDKSANLKSCIKKEGGIRALRNLRVTFDFTSLIEY